MATFEDTRQTLGSGHVAAFAATLLHRAVSFVVSVRNRRQVARLLSWDAHMLRDIGLTPGDVQAAMSGPLREDPSYRLAFMASERRAGQRAAARERLRLRSARDA